MAVYMYSIYKDLDVKNGDLQDLQAVQTMRDQLLYRAMHLRGKVPHFPLDMATFEKHRHVLEEISKKNKMLCLLFVYDGKCHVLNSGTYTEYDSVAQAQQAVFDVKEDANVMRVVNKYHV